MKEEGDWGLLPNKTPLSTWETSKTSLASYLLPLSQGCSYPIRSGWDGNSKKLFRMFVRWCLEINSEEARTIQSRELDLKEEALHWTKAGGGGVG